MRIFPKPFPSKTFNDIKLAARSNWLLGEARGCAFVHSLSNSPLQEESSLYDRQKSHIYSV